MAKLPRMSDVARHAGVSTMTVSRVLNQQPNVTDEVRQRVNAAIRELRYQPNELARSLRERRSRQIGIIVPYLLDPFFAVCAHAVSTVAKRRSYSVVISTSNEDAATELEEAHRMLRRNVEGLILIPARGANGQELLADREVPIVAVDRPLLGAFDSVLVENEAGARVGTRHLIALGHRRITFVGLTGGVYTMECRAAGYIDAMRQSGLMPHLLEVSTQLSEMREAIRALLADSAAPSALFCGNNLLTRHVLHCLQALGVHPPQQIALVGFDDFETADLVVPGITVVRQPVEQLGVVAAEMLFARLDKRAIADATTPSQPEQHVLPVELIVRGSCGEHVTGQAALPAQRKSVRRRA
jgi:LacI family transcriptional regulator